MIYTETEIPGVWIIEPKVFKDARGYFMEAFKQEEFDAHIGPTRFIQDNESCLPKVYCADSIISRLLILRQNWYVSLKALSLIGCRYP